MGELESGICDECFDISDELYMGLCPLCLKKHMGLEKQPIPKKKRFDDEEQRSTAEGRNK